VLTIANVEQAAAWDGPEGDHWTEHAERYDRTIKRHRARLLDAGMITTSADVLDIGCGTGALTREAARQASTGSVLGMDLSAKMLARARELSSAQGLTNVRFTQADAQVHPFTDGSVDTVISSFGTLFFRDPGAAFANIARALRPGGRICMLAWRELARNDWLIAIRTALAAGRTLPEPPRDAPGPFGLADANRVRELLAGAGFDDIHFEPIDEAIDWGTDTDDACNFLRVYGPVKGLIENLDDSTKAAAFDQLRATVAVHETDYGVLFGSSAWLITAQRR
jgi:SAM-dependent methyltransferase